MDRPILFSGAMVRALLAGTKTQTRRAIKPKGHASLFDGSWADSYVLDPGNQSWREREYPWRVGDRLYVREEFSGPHDFTGTPPRDWEPLSTPIHFWADGNPEWGDWTRPKPGMHMPRWASRITLTVTDVRVERLQVISDVDAIAEGIEDVTNEVASGDKSLRFWKRYRDGGWNGYVDSPTGSYASLWTEINGEGSWETNPWVVAVSFAVEPRNIDEVA